MDWSNLYAIGFQKLVMDIVAKPTTENLTTFKQLLEDMDANQLCEMQKLCMFPLLNVLRKHQSRYVIVESALYALGRIMDKTQVRSWDVFKDIAGCLCVLSHKLKESKENDVVVFALVIRTMSSLMCAATTDVLLSASNPENLSSVKMLWSHMIYGSIQLCEKKCSREDKVVALQLIFKLTIPSRVSAECGNLVTVFSECFPGISTACFQLITRPQSTAYVGHEVVCQALDTFQAVICLVLSTSSCESLLADQRDCQRKVTSSIVGDLKYKDTSVTEETMALSGSLRSAKWLEISISNLKLIITNLASLAYNEAWDVRVAFANFLEKMVCKCFRVLASLLPNVIRSLLIMCEDEHPEVAQRASTALCGVKVLLTENSELTDVTDQLRELFIKTLESLPLAARSQDNFTATLQFLLGFLRHCDSHVATVLTMGDFSERFIDSLLYVIRLDLSHFDIFDDYSGELLQYKFLTDSKSRNLFFAICKVLGERESTFYLLRCLVTNLDQELSDSLERVVLLNRILDGFVVVKPSDLEERQENAEVLLALLDQYSSSDMWIFCESTVLLRKSPIVDESAVNTVALPSKVATLRTCLVFMGFQKLAKLFGTLFIPHLNNCLYIILAKLMSGIPIIEQTALATLASITDSCGYSSVQDLIQENMEYITNSVVLRLRHFSRHPEVIFVLSSAIGFCTTQVMPLLLRITKNILRKLDEVYHLGAYPFVLVLRVVLRKFEEWTQDTDEKPLKAVKTAGHNTTESMEYLKNSYFPDGDQQTSERSEGSETEDESEESEKSNCAKVPEEITIVVEIVQRSGYLLTVNHRELRSALIDVLISGCHVLKKWTEQLLPAMHQMWIAIKVLHRTDDLVIFRKAFLCLCEMCDVAGSFLGHRVCSEIIPVVAKFLGTEALKSFTSDFRYVDQITSSESQLEIIFFEQLGPLLKAVNADEKAYAIIIDAAIFFIDTRYLSEVQAACVRFFLFIVQHQPEMVVVKLLLSTEEGQKDLPPVQVAQHCPRLVRSGRNYAVITKAAQLLGASQQLDKNSGSV